MSKLNISYLSKAEVCMAVNCGFLTETLTATLMDSKIGNRVKLTDTEMELLVSDIRKAKELGLWSVPKEEQTIERCYRRYNRLNHIKKLSPTERERYYQIVSETLFTL